MLECELVQSRKRAGSDAFCAGERPSASRTCGGPGGTWSRSLLGRQGAPGQRVWRRMRVEERALRVVGRGPGACAVAFGGPRRRSRLRARPRRLRDAPSRRQLSVGARRRSAPHAELGAARRADGRVATARGARHDGDARGRRPARFSTRCRIRRKFRRRSPLSSARSPRTDTRTRSRSARPLLLTRASSGGRAGVRGDAGATRADRGATARVLRGRIPRRSARSRSDRIVHPCSRVSRAWTIAM